MKSIRASLAAINVAIDGIKQRLDANSETLRLHQGLLTRALAESRVSALLSTVDGYLGQLEASGELEFEGADDRANVTRKLKDRIRQTMLNQVLDRPDLSDTQLRRRIERLVDRYLDDF